MDFIGEIVSEPDPPGISKERWVELITDHPCLEPCPSANEGTNPSTRKPMIFRSPAGCAWVIVDATKVGTMDWAQDGSNCIIVSGEPGPVVPLAHNIAEILGARFNESRVE